MSTVYKAYQPGTERLVAIKVMLEHFSQDASAVERFQQEARVIARLEHHNIVPIYDSGRQGDTFYLVMRYMRAGTVQDIINHKPLPLPDALSLIKDVAAALDYAHARHIIHRDIKPNNILVDNEGHAYLTDFGLAKVLGITGALSSTSMTVGTPAYMAPEQVMGQQVTPQTDIYALGVMLYEMLTGEPPFVAESAMAVALMHVQQRLRPPRQVNPALSEAVELVILRAMAKDPADRFQTAGQMTAALADAIESETWVQPTQLATLAEEIAETKSTEDITPEIRRALQRQDQQARRKRILAWAPWIAVGCLVISLVATLLFTFSSSMMSGITAGQTATAAALLLEQLESAQTAIASGASGSEPTLEYLQTRLAQGTTVGATSTSIGTQAAPWTSTPRKNIPPATKAAPRANTATPRPVRTRIPPLPTLPVKLP